MERAEDLSGKVIPVERNKAFKSENPLKPHVIQGGAGEISGSIDKIRDILFGNQMTDYEKRFSRVEGRLAQEVTVSKSESRKRIDSLERFFISEVESMKDHLMAEQSARSKAIHEISMQIKDAVRSFERRLDHLESQLTRHSRDTDDQISEQGKGLRNEMRQKHEEISTLIEQAVRELRGDKMDRSALADFFMDMAMRITDDKDHIKPVFRAGDLHNE